MRTSLDLQLALDEGSLAFYKRKQKNECPIRLSNAGTCAHRVALQTTAAPERPIDGVASRLFERGTMIGDALARGLALVEGKRLGYRVLAREMEHWLSVLDPDDQPWTIEEAHSIMAVLLHRFGNTAESPLPVRFNEETRRFEILGHSDVVLVDDNAMMTVGDFKSTKDWSWRKVEADDWRSIEENYLAQLGCYTQSLIEDTMVRSANVKVGDPFMCYENRDEQTEKIVFVPVDELTAYAAEARRQFARILRAVGEEKQQLVQRGFGPDDTGKLPWQCNYCPVPQACWGELWINKAPNARIPKGYVDGVNHGTGTEERLVESEEAL